MRIGFIGHLLLALALVVPGGATSAQVYPPATERLAQDADGMDLSIRDGPAVWVEEHWDVKPDNLEQFLIAYEKEYYSLARKTPGYRGYTVLTTLPPLFGEANPTTQLGGKSPFIRGHSAVRIAGGKRTNRVANWGLLFNATHNVVIIHHIASWAHADRFRENIALEYQNTDRDQPLADHLALTLYPFANNTWSAEYRLVNSSWSRFPTKNTGQTDDADGLNLEPGKGPHVLVGERWDVEPEQFCQWLEAYSRDVYQVIRRTPGYRGWAIATSLPPQKCEGDVAPLTSAGRDRLGGSDQLYVPAPGLLQNGIVRTDLSINVGAVYKKTFNVILMHQIDNWKNSDAWSKNYNEVYSRDSDGGEFTELWAKNLMTLANNHWDTYMRIVESSYTPLAEE